MSDDLTLPAREDARAIWVFTAELDPPGGNVGVARGIPVEYKRGIRRGR